jgi:putative Mg2+ transporter-C (MgtC) family protein
MLRSQATYNFAMLATLPTHFTTIEQVDFLQGTTTRLLMACAMGAVVGMEREWRHKASGLRTNILICLGSALFTILSGVLAGAVSPNRGQVASNIVQGIGFLGAGLILHTRSRVLGLTSAATVWVVAALGMACGAGLYVEAAIATGIVYCSLRFIGLMESRAEWKRYVMLYEVRGPDEKTLFAEVLSVLDKGHIRLNIVERDKLGDMERVTFTVSASSARHKQLLAELIASNATDHVSAFRDEDED